MASSLAAINVDRSTEPYPWILHPVIDFFTCGGGLEALFFVLVMLMPSVFVGTALGKAIVITTLITLNMPHGISSYLRVYNSEHTSKKIKRQVTILAVICGFAAFSTLLSDFAWSIFAHITWFLGVQHLFNQSYGISLVYCYKRKYYFSKWEQRIYWFAVQMGTIYAISNVFARSDVHLLSRAVGPAWVPAWTPHVTLVILYASIFAFSAVLVRKYLQEHKIFPTFALTGILLSYLYQGCLPFLLKDPVLTVMALSPNLHLTQYLAITTSFHLKDVGLPANTAFSQISRQLLSPVALKYYAFLLGAGWLTTICVIPEVWQLGKAIGFNVDLVAVAVYMAINVHHYLTDSLIWKQKDPAIRKILLA